MATRRKTTAAEPETADFPTWWDFPTDGNTCEGTFVGAGSGFTAMGERPFVTLDVAGVLRTVWLHHEVLRLTFAREVARREDQEIHVGERVKIERLPERESGTGRKYINYRVEFADSPQVTQASIFGPSDTQEASAPAEGVGEDGIPF